jgi:hypothetical protein
VDSQGRSVVTFAIASRDLPPLVGAGWQPPAIEDVFTTLPAFCTGDAAAGLPAFAGPVASPSSRAAWILAVEAVMIIAMVVGMKIGAGAVGSGSRRGHGQPSRGPNSCGLTRLRGNAPVIRPDLHPRKASGDDLGVSFDPVRSCRRRPGHPHRDLLLSFTARTCHDRPCVVLDPFGLVPACPTDVGTRRQLRRSDNRRTPRQRSTVGTVESATAGGHSDDAAASAPPKQPQSAKPT